MEIIICNKKNKKRYFPFVHHPFKIESSCSKHHVGIIAIFLYKNCEKDDAWLSSVRLRVQHQHVYEKIFPLLRCMYGMIVSRTLSISLSLYLGCVKTEVTPHLPLPGRIGK